MINQKAKILIVDDAVENIRLLAEILKVDYDILIAKNGREAISFIAKETLPDLILLDIMMPDIDGYEVCKAFKENEKTKTIPIIFLSALRENDEEYQGLSLGAEDYIRKPFNAEIVKVRVRNLVKLKKYQDYLEYLLSKSEEQLERTQKEYLKLFL